MVNSFKCIQTNSHKVPYLYHESSWHAHAWKAKVQINSKRKKNDQVKDNENTGRKDIDLVV
jgi:6-pyruvoyl-tetrahydropterin synthase